jgi:hypothetical protein
MCVVSAVGDNWRDTFPKKYPNWEDVINHIPQFVPNPTSVVKDADLEQIKADIASIRSDMIELKKLLKAAIEYDEKTGQRHCETEDKIALIKRVADAVGVDLSDLHLE